MPTSNDHPPVRGVTRGKQERTGRGRMIGARPRDAITGYAFIAPQLIGTCVFVLIPLGLMAYYSLREWNVLSGDFIFVGSTNYTKFIADPQLPGVMRATAIFSMGLVLVNLPLALLLAVLVDRRGRRIALFRTIFFSPVVVSLIAWTLVWKFLLQDNGGINGFLAAIGLPGVNWLREGPTAMASMILVQVFKNVGLNMVLFLAALQGVPRELYEAGRVDGASPFMIFRKITLPLISPTVLLTMVLTIAGSLQIFAQIDVLTKGGPGLSTTVLAYYLFQQAFQLHHFGYGSMIAICLFGIIFILTVAQWQLRKKWVFYEN